MTKQEMIKTIKTREADLWYELLESEEKNGKDSIKSISLQDQWNAIFQLIKDLGIE